MVLSSEGRCDQQSRALGSLATHGLTSLLKEKGVPVESASSRATEAIAKIGDKPIQKALQASNPWREIKQLANHTLPPFQLVLASELQDAVAHRASMGPAAPRKNRCSKAMARKGDQSKPVMPALQKLKVPSGIFVDGETPLHQLALNELGPTSSGVVLVHPAEASPYLTLAKPVSRNALALVVVGEVDLSGASVKFETLRFCAECAETGAPALVSGTLVQIGDRWVSEHIPAPTSVEQIPSSVVRVAVFRNQFEADWATFVSRPLKHVIDQVLLLRTCSTTGCTCECWHGSSAPGEPAAILEAWSRSWFRQGYKAEPPATATVFNVFIRIPAGLELPLQALSGVRGIFEPRAADARDPSLSYRVLWLPRASFQEVVLLKQSHSEVVGLARVNDRFGIRCLREHEESLHKLVKETPFVDKTKLRRFHAGPFPYGTQRRAVTKALTDMGWKACPMQPAPGHAGGLWWVVHAEAAPPKSVLHTQFGEVIFSEVPSREQVKPPAPLVLASQAHPSQLSGLGCHII